MFYLLFIPENGLFWALTTVGLWPEITPGEGVYLPKFKTERLRPEVQPLTLLYTILVEKVPHLYTFYKRLPLSHTYFRKYCSYFNKYTDTAIRGISSKYYS